MAFQFLSNFERPEELWNDLSFLTARATHDQPVIANAFSHLTLDAGPIMQPLAMLSRIHILAWLLLEALMAHASIQASVSFVVHRWGLL